MIATNGIGKVLPEEALGAGAALLAWIRNDIETVVATVAVIDGTRTCTALDDETDPVTDGGQENVTV